MESILTTDKNTCYICQRYLRDGEAELHHIFEGHGLRPISDRLGLVVYLCSSCHRGDNGVHSAKGISRRRDLQKIAQFTWEQRHSHEEWMAIVGRNYL